MWKHSNTASPTMRPTDEARTLKCNKPRCTACFCAWKNGIFQPLFQCRSGKTGENKVPPDFSMRGHFDMWVHDGARPWHASWWGVGCQHERVIQWACQICLKVHPMSVACDIMGHQGRRTDVRPCWKVNRCTGEGTAGTFPLRTSTRVAPRLAAGHQHLQ